MEKILISGEENAFLNSLFEILRNEYEVHICEYVGSTINNNIQLMNPCVTVILKPMNAGIAPIIQVQDACEGNLVVVCEEGDTTMQKYQGTKLFSVNKPIRLELLKDMIASHAGDNGQAVAIPSILAVDDNGIELRSLKKLLEDEYELFFATSGAKALEMMKKRSFDLVLLDYEMPGMNGYEVFMEMLRHVEMREIPVVFLTGVSDRKRIMELKAYPPAGYLLKPIDKALLEKTLNDVLKK